MNPHPYLRAFLAGVFVPTLVLPLLLTGFIVVRLVLQFPVPIERGIIFPMALVPSLWGIWNMLWQTPAIARASRSEFSAHFCRFSWFLWARWSRHCPASSRLALQGSSGFRYGKFRTG